MQLGMMRGTPLMLRLVAPFPCFKSFSASLNNWPPQWCLLMNEYDNHDRDRDWVAIFVASWSSCLWLWVLPAVSTAVQISEPCLLVQKFQTLGLRKAEGLNWLQSEGRESQRLPVDVQIIIKPLRVLTKDERAPCCLPYLLLFRFLFNAFWNEWRMPLAGFTFVGFRDA